MGSAVVPVDPWEKLPPRATREQPTPGAAHDSRVALPAVSKSLPAAVIVRILPLARFGIGCQKSSSGKKAESAEGALGGDASANSVAPFRGPPI